MLDRRYWFVRIRTTRKYIAFLFLQLVLSFVVTVVGLTNEHHFRSTPTVVLEIVICLCIAFDLLIRINSQASFWRSKGNLLDVIVFACLIGIVVYVSVSTSKGDDVVLETDDIVLLVIIIVRYSVQILRLGCMIKKSHDSVSMQKELKQIDLNDPKLATNGQSTVPDLEVHGSHVFRNKLMDIARNNEDANGMHRPLNEEASSSMDPHHPTEKLAEQL